MTDPSVPPAVGRALGSPRTLAAWALVGYAALHLVFTLIMWFPPGGGGSFSDRSASTYYDFTNLIVMSMPVLAVVLAAYVTPAVSGARLLALIALAEYAVAVLFGFLAFLFGLGAQGVHNFAQFLGTLRYLVMGFATFVLIAVAAYVVYRAFTTLGGRLPIGRTVTPPSPAA
jgi:hypothetical protein